MGKLLLFSMEILEIAILTNCKCNKNYMTSNIHNIMISLRLEKEMTAIVKMRVDSLDIKFCHCCGFVICLTLDLTFLDVMFPVLWPKSFLFLLIFALV